MKKKTTPINLTIEANIIKALNHLRNNYSYVEPKRFDQEEVFRDVKLTRVFVTIIKHLGIIEYPIPAHIVVTNKIETISPREIHLAIAEYAKASQKRAAKKKQKIKAQELAKVQAKLRFENKRKLRGVNNDNGYQEALRNAVPPPQPSFNDAYNTFFNRLNPLANASTPPPQPQNLFNVQGAYYPQMNTNMPETSGELSTKELLDMMDTILPKGFKIPDMLKAMKAALREEIKDELRREIIADLVSKS